MNEEIYKFLKTTFLWENNYTMGEFFLFLMTEDVSKSMIINYLDSGSEIHEAKEWAETAYNERNRGSYQNSIKGWKNQKELLKGAESIKGKYFKGDYSEWLFLQGYFDMRSLRFWAKQQPAHHRLQDLIFEGQIFIWSEPKTENMNMADIQELKDLIKSIQKPEPVTVVEAIVDTKSFDYWKQRTLLAETFLNAGSKNRAERRKAYRDFMEQNKEPLV